MVCQASSLSAHYDAVSQLLASPGVEPRDKLRATLLFALRYERDGAPQVAQLGAALARAGVDAPRLALLKGVLKYCGTERRVVDLFSDRTLTSRFATLAKQHLKVGGELRGC